MAYIGLQRQLVSPTGEARTIAVDGLVKFGTDIAIAGTNEVATYQSAEPTGEQPPIGTFTFTKAGYYLVEWFVVLQSALATSGPIFTLEVTTTDKTDAENPTTNTVSYPSSSSIKTGALSGSAVIQASKDTNITTTVVLKNKTGGVAAYATNVAVVANISITNVMQQIDGLEVTFTDAGTTSLAEAATVAFDTVKTASSSGVMTNAAGVITVTSAGIYIFDWSVSLAGEGGAANGLKFELKKDATPDKVVVGTSISASVTQGTITGSAVVIAAANDKFQLVNSSGVTVQYDALAVKASMRVFTII